jgi:hypothetical protein
MRARVCFVAKRWRTLLQPSVASQPMTLMSSAVSAKAKAGGRSYQSPSGVRFFKRAKLRLCALKAALLP